MIPNRIIPSAPLGTAMSLALLAAGPSLLQGQSLTSEALEGAWSANRYHLASGATHEVRGRIFFTDRDWQVLFFVVDESGAVQRGSGEGGTYTLDGAGLVFTHLFNLSVGEEMPGLPAAPLRMTARSPDGAPTEPTRIDVDGNRLTLHFPSGNRMTFDKRR